MQSKLNLTLLIASLLSALIFVIGLIFFFGGVIHNIKPTPALNAVVPKTDSAIVAPVADESDVPTSEVTPASTEPSQAVAKTASPAQVEESPQPIQYTAEMTAAGIAPTDQPIALALLFDGPIWKSGLGQPGVRYALDGGSPTERFERANSYVTSRYGSWSAALTQSQNTGGAW